MKFCKFCDGEFAADDMKHWRWVKDKTCKAGGYLQCKPRANHHSDAYWERKGGRPVNRAYKRAWMLKKHYGITQDEYNYMMVMQSDRCAICLTDDKGVEEYWMVDHNHETGEVRGLLCGPCNRALGMFDDDADNLVQATNYLRRLPTNA